MTEITERAGKLPNAAERFVLHWGDMGGQWGVNRSISQIHALLYLSERPRTAEDIARGASNPPSTEFIACFALTERPPPAEDTAAVLGPARSNFPPRSGNWWVG